MPIENEIKILLENSPKLESKIAKLASQSYHIEQCYLYCGKNFTLRLRKQKDKSGKIRFTFTVKKKTTPSRVIEIEKKISEEDYLELVKDATNWLTKTRYIVNSWDVDFFKKDGETYFVMAELEMPDGMQEPSKIPSFIEESLLFKVPRDDGRFSSKKISDVFYAKHLLKQVNYV